MTVAMFNLGSERLDLGSERPDFGFSRPDLSSEGLLLGLRCLVRDQ